MSGDIKTGGWTIGERLTSTQMNAARAEIIKSVDGVAGGTYSGPIILNDLTMGGSNRLGYETRQVTRSCVRLTDGTSDDPTRWGLVSSLTERPRWTTLLTGNVALWLPCRFPAGSVLESIAVYVQGGSGHGALPFSMPTATLYSCSQSGVSMTSRGTGTDAMATVGAYEGEHSIAITGMSHTVLSTLQYWLCIIPEGGANDEPGFAVGGALCTVEMTMQDEWT